MPDNIRIYVDNKYGRDEERPTAGNLGDPVRTADRAFGLLPCCWRGAAEIIFSPDSYALARSAVYFGTPIGPEASPLVLRGGYSDVLTVTAAVGSGGDWVDTSIGRVGPDLYIGKVLKRLSGPGSDLGTAISIRGNVTNPDGTTRLALQRSIGEVRAGESFVIQEPNVTLVPSNTLNLTSHDGRSINLTMIGIKIAPATGKGINFFNVRALCDTCELSLADGLVFVHSNSRIQGGIGDATISPGLGDLRGPAGPNTRSSRAQAGVFITSRAPANFISAVRGGILTGHLTFKDIVVQVSQGATFVPKSLEALNAPIHILAGGEAVAERSIEGARVYTGWGTESNKARIRNVDRWEEIPNTSDIVPVGDGLRVLNGGSINSPLGPIHLDVYGCIRDGIRLDVGSSGSFGGTPMFSSELYEWTGGETGLVTTGPPNGYFGMNVRNGSRAFIGSDAANATVPSASPPGARPLRGSVGEVGLDDIATNWNVVIESPRSNNKGSSVCLNR